MNGAASQRSLVVFRSFPRRPFVRPNPRISNPRRLKSRTAILRCTNQSASSSTGESPMSAAIVEAMRSKIQEALNAEKVEVVDVEGDHQHVTINVISSAFEGKSSVDRQRMVYKAIWYELQNVVHAVDAMTTKTPAEASQ